jgi:hypothetical protein
LCHELLSWLARLSMHHREKLKFLLVFVLHSYMQSNLDGGSIRDEFLDYPSCVAKL